MTNTHDDGAGGPVPSPGAAAEVTLGAALPGGPFGHLPSRPGKVIAVHLSYRSRVEQRGRSLENPSYFLKPSSSVGVTGGTLARPAGCELLAFEGEIALVIGDPARWVTEADAWEHVAWVTAANDLGVYDMRAADRGSNARSKGGDGFLPIGPELIDARAAGPDGLRLRAWVNGELLQHDGSEGLLFGLPRIVADLSQHFTLETGDVILTGTPAGSSVAVPGDVMEVEVDAPSAAGAPTSGRLVTRVTGGQRAFDPELGDIPRADETQRIAAWGDEGLARLTAESGIAAARSEMARAAARETG